jgi:hypothetical protein
MESSGNFCADSDDVIDVRAEQAGQAGCCSFRPYHFSAPAYVPLNRRDLEARYGTIGEAFMIYTTSAGFRQLKEARGMSKPLVQLR